MMRIANSKELEGYRKKVLAKRPADRRVVAVCAGTGCKAYGSFTLLEAFNAAIKEAGLEGEVEVRQTGCHGFCERGPLVVIFPEKTFYQRVKPEDAEEIIEETIKKGEVIERLCYDDPVDGKLYTKEEDIPFYKHQKRLLLGQNGRIDPTSIDDYISIGGYNALSKALSMEAEEVLEEVKKANLRGRGGGGFPAGRKWETCRKAAGEIKYVICNADEGDPGAFMDRSLLEGNPHSVIEGMIIGSHAIGAQEGYVYVRNEYPLAVERLGIALKQAEEKGLLGENILGTGHNLSIKINRGGGAFVCGESTALMASIEGKVGEPRAKHIHTVESGLNDRPSNLNNVETWANVPLIIDKGAEWYSSIGTENSKGTKIFSLVGKVNNTGLVEAPMGMTMRQIIYDIGGGIPNKGEFKAVQTGGPSGGCLPSKYLDLPVDFDELWEHGSMMGSGGMIVMDQDTCMVDVARYFLGFLKFESCGKCTTCREGIRQLHALIEDITQGRGTEETLTLIEELSATVEAASLCALGTTAINPVRSTLKYFREEYEAHVKDKKCPGKVCKELITFTIDETNCNGCMVCKKRCPQECISGEKKQLHTIEQSKCIKCGVCRDVCKFEAVNVE